MKFKTDIDSFTISFVKWVIKWRWLILVFSVSIAAMLASGVRFLSFNTDYKAFFEPDNPQLLAFEKLQKIYTKNSNILFVLSPEKGQVFTAPFLDAVDTLTREAWKIPYAIRVDAITNFQHIRAIGDDIIVEGLVPQAKKMTPKELEMAHQIAIAQPQLLNRLISPSAHATGVNVTLQLPGINSRSEVPLAVAYARQIADSIRTKYKDIEIYQTGMVMLNNAFSEVSKNEIRTLIPIMYLCMIIVMWLLLRSFSGTIVTLFIIILSSLSAMGLAGWFRIGLTPPSVQAPTLIMTLAVADSIHILITMLGSMRNGVSKKDAIIESFRVNMQPVFITSVTTAIGFFSMNMSDVPPFQHLGNITAAGVIFAWLYTIFCTPAFLAILPVRVKVKKVQKSMLIDRLANFVIHRHRPLLWGSCLLVLVMAVFITKNELNDQFVYYFNKNNKFRKATDYMMDNLTGIYQIEFSLGSGESGGISNPDFLKKLDEYSQWYLKQPHVIQVNAFSDVMKRLNKAMHGDDADYYCIPESRDLAAQYLVFYEMSLPYGLDLNNQINVDKSSTRFTITLSNVTTREIMEVTSNGEKWLRLNAPDYMFGHGVGSAVMFAHGSFRNIKTMLKSTTLAIVFISIALIFAFRSFKFGGLSLVFNLIPAVLAFGLWGLLVGQINVALSIVTGMTLGIVVDDTVHFLSKYLRARRERQLGPEDAIRFAFASVGKALIVTSVILIIGFGTLSFSSFEMNAGMGKLTAMIIFFALLTDFLLLPQLLMKIEGRV